MNIDLKQMSAELADVSADALLKKDIAKHKDKIFQNIEKIETYLATYNKERNEPLNQDILKMGYWLYEMRSLCEQNIRAQPKKWKWFFNIFLIILTLQTNFVGFF